MIKWLNQEVIPATYRDLDGAAKENGKLRVYSVERRTGSRVTEVYQKQQQIVPIFDGSLEQRQKLIKKTRAIRLNTREGQHKLNIQGVGPFNVSEDLEGGDPWRRRELKKGWGAVELIIRYLVRQQERAIK